MSEKALHPKPEKSVALAALGQIDPRELSPEVPIRWQNVDADARPFDTWQEEYIRSPRPVPIPVLRKRWIGLYNNEQLDKIRETAELRRQRFFYQDELAKESLKQSIAGDVEFQKRWLDDEIIHLIHLCKTIDVQLEAGVEYAPVKGAGKLGYVYRPLVVDSIDKLMKRRTELSDAIMKRLGLANEVLNINVNVTESLEVRMGRFMETHDDEYQFLQAEYNKRLGRANSQVAPLPASSGVAMESQKAFEDHQRKVIEYIPPRVVDALPENTKSNE